MQANPDDVYVGYPSSQTFEPVIGLAYGQYTFPVVRQVVDMLAWQGKAPEIAVQPGRVQFGLHPWSPASWQYFLRKTKRGVSFRLSSSFVAHTETPAMVEHIEKLVLNFKTHRFTSLRILGPDNALESPYATFVIRELTYGPLKVS